MSKTLSQLWHQHSSPTTSHLVVKHAQLGTEITIEGLRPEDDRGGCMATGTEGGLYGSDENDKYWFMIPQGFTDEWIFVKAHEQKFYVRKQTDLSKIYRGINERNGGQYQIVDSNGDRVWVSSNDYEKVSEPNIYVNAKSFKVFLTGLFIATVITVIGSLFNSEWKSVAYTLALTLLFGFFAHFNFSKG